MEFFGTWTQVIGGLFIGALFGFFLRKAYVTRFDTIVKQLMLQDFTVLKVMLTAIAFGSFGIYLLKMSADVPSTIFATTIGAAAVGGAIFGIGMAVMGFCPGTAIGALADGARDMRYGMLGMVAGAFLYAEAAPFFAQHLKQETDMTKLTLVDATGWSAIVFATAFLPMVAAMKFFLDRKKS